MEINNNEYGGFIVSKNIIENHIPVKFTFREESSIPQLNGWTLFSSNDDQDYVNDSHNFVILSASSLFQIIPTMKDIFDAPYGTEISWLYEKDVLVGFYDLVHDKEVTLQQILHP